MQPEVGKKAPGFTLYDADEIRVSLIDFIGQRVLIYFYPRDDTPGCTKQACGFRDLWDEIKALNTVVLGISPDDALAHKKFTEKYKLPFRLLCDPEKQVMKVYGAWGEKVLYGRKSIGVIRSTVLVDESGVVLKHWRKVPNAKTHPEKVLDVLKNL